MLTLSRAGVKEEFTKDMIASVKVDIWKGPKFKETILTAIETWSTDLLCALKHQFKQRVTLPGNMLLPLANNQSVLDWLIQSMDPPTLSEAELLDVLKALQTEFL
jgi:hypothetical protein